MVDVVRPPQARTERQSGFNGLAAAAAEYMSPKAALAAPGVG